MPDAGGMEGGFPVQLAQATPVGGLGEPIGKVGNVAGKVTIIRVDGTEVQATKGMPVYQGDDVATGEIGNIGITFADSTTFALGSKGRMVLDEMVYDPGDQQGSLAVHVAKGVFSFVSGQVAKTGTDAMMIKTPVATIGIRGTSGGGVANEEGQPNTFSLTPDPDGSVGEATFSAGGLTQVLNQPFATTQTSSAFLPAPRPIILPAEVVFRVFGATMQVAVRQQAGNQGDAATGDDGGDDGGDDDAAAGEGDTPPPPLPAAMTAEQAANLGMMVGGTAFQQALNQGADPMGAMNAALAAGAMAVAQQEAGMLGPYLGPDAAFGIGGPAIPDIAALIDAIAAQAVGSMFGGATTPQESDGFQGLGDGGFFYLGPDLSPPDIGYFEVSFDGGGPDIDDFDMYGFYAPLPDETEPVPPATSDDTSDPEPDPKPDQESAGSQLSAIFSGNSLFVSGNSGGVVEIDLTLGTVTDDGQSVDIDGLFTGISAIDASGLTASGGIKLIGDSQNNILTLAAGDNTVHGGDGVDKAVLAGDSGDWTITGSGSYLTLAGSGRTNLLYDIATLGFDSGDIGIDMVGELHVNADYTAGYQHSASLTVLTGGGFVVTWQDGSGRDGSGDGIYAKMFDSLGRAVGEEFLVTTTTTANQRYPSASWLSNGGFVIAWEDSGGTDGQGYGVFIQRYDADGSKVGAETNVYTAGTGDQWLASVTSLEGSGSGFVVTWQDDSQGIMAKVYGVDGSVTKDSFIIADKISGDFIGTGSPDVAALSDGGFVISWKWEHSGTAGEIYAQRYDASGNAVGGQIAVNSFTTGGQENPVVAGLADGGFAVAWHDVGDGYSIKSRVFDANGNAVTGELTVDADWNYDPDITALANGNFVVSWRDDMSAKDIWARIYDADGTAIGDSFTVNSTLSGTQTRPSIDAHSDGGFIIAWESPHEGTTNIYAQRYDADGKAFGGLTLNGASGDDIMVIGGGIAAVYGGSGNDTIDISGSSDAVILQYRSTEYGAGQADTIIGFTAGSGGDVFQFLDAGGNNLDLSLLRGDGYGFQKGVNTWIHPDVGLFVFNDPYNESQMDGAINGGSFTWEIGDIVYFVAADGADTHIYRAADGNSNTGDGLEDIQLVATLQGMGDTSALTADNFDGFSPPP